MIQEYKSLQSFFLLFLFLFYCNNDKTSPNRIFFFFFYGFDFSVRFPLFHCYFFFCFVLRICIISNLSFCSFTYLTCTCYELNRLLYQSSTSLLQSYKVFVQEILHHQFYVSLALALHYKKSRNILYVCYCDKHNLNRH